MGRFTFTSGFFEALITPESEYDGRGRPEEASDSWRRLLWSEEHISTQDGVLFHHIICSLAHQDSPNE